MRIIKGILKFFGGLLCLLVLVYLLGPRTKIPTLTTDLPALNQSLETVESYIKNKEAAVEGLKPNNEAKIVWNQAENKSRTDYSIVYLHGFSASGEEGAPLHREIAKRYGCNLYISRLEEHGIEKADLFKDLTAEAMLASAKEALSIGALLGEKVLLMCSSTGATSGFYLAAHHPETVAGVVAYSPNIDFYDKKSSLLVKPWGLQIARAIIGSKNRGFEATEEIKKHWVNEYRIEGVVAVKALIKATMKESTFKKIEQPVLVGYYYKDEEACDKIISIERIGEMFEQLGTAKDLKRKVAFPNVDTHVIGSKYYSKDLESVRLETFDFLEETMNWEAIEK